MVMGRMTTIPKNKNVPTRITIPVKGTVQKNLTGSSLAKLISASATSGHPAPVGIDTHFPLCRSQPERADKLQQVAEVKSLK
jgi:hypothetical protein